MFQPARDKVNGHSIQTEGAREAPTKAINCCQTTGTEEIDMAKDGRGEKERERKRERREEKKQLKM